MVGLINNEEARKYLNTIIHTITSAKVFQTEPFECLANDDNYMCENKNYCDFYIRYILNEKDTDRCKGIIETPIYIYGKKMWINPIKIWKSQEKYFITSTFVSSINNNTALYVAKDKDSLVIREYDKNNDFLSLENSLVCGLHYPCDIARYLGIKEETAKKLKKNKNLWELYTSNKNILVKNLYGPYGISKEKIWFIPISILNKQKNK